jgi:hypothetical protein
MVIHDHIPEKREGNPWNIGTLFSPEFYSVTKLRRFVSEITDKPSGKERMGASAAGLIFLEKCSENREKFSGRIFPLHFSPDMKNVTVQPDLQNRIHPDIGIDLVGRRVLRSIQEKTGLGIFINRLKNFPGSFGGAERSDHKRHKVPGKWSEAKTVLELFFV